MRLLAVWFVAVLITSYAARPTTWSLIVAGVLVGALAGALQLQSMRQATGASLASTSLMEVRRAMTSTRVGRSYVYAFWSGLVALLALSAYLLGNRFFLGWVASYCALAFTRELITMRGIVELESKALSR
jgi:hypothetical protein